MGSCISKPDKPAKAPVRYTGLKAVCPLGVVREPRSSSSASSSRGPYNHDAAARTHSSSVQSLFESYAGAAAVIPPPLEANSRDASPIPRDIRGNSEATMLSPSFLSRTQIGFDDSFESMDCDVEEPAEATNPLSGMVHRRAPSSKEMQSDVLTPPRDDASCVLQGEPPVEEHVPPAPHADPTGVSTCPRASSFTLPKRTPLEKEMDARRLRKALNSAPTMRPTHPPVPPLEPMAEV